MSGRREDARQVYDETLGQAPPNHVIVRARLHRKMAKTWEGQHPHTEALRLYDRAREILGESVNDEQATEAGSASWRDEWVQLRSDQVFANYWLGRVSEIARLVDELRAEVLPSAPAWQRVRLHRAELHLCFHRDRYQLDDAGVAHARAALDDCRAAGDTLDLPLAQFHLAFALFLRRDFEAAERELKDALRVAERTGDVPHQVRCLTYLSINARRTNDIDAVRARVAQIHRLAGSAAMRDYVGVALAHEAWLACRSGDASSSEQLAERALAEWRGLAFVYAFQWTALLPLLHARVSSGNIEAAARHALALLEPPQQRLPDEVSERLSAGIASARAHEFAVASGSFLEALSGAERHHFM